MNSLPMRFLAALFATLPIAATPALAQDWPSKAVRIIVPSAPGGGTDTYARTMSTALADVLRQPFLVENRPGGNGNIGAEAVARASPDGYTILFSASPALIMNPALYPKLSYSAERDLTPVAAGVVAPLMFCVHPSIPVKTLAELAAYGRRYPGKLTYGSAGQTSGTAMGVRLLEEASGAQFTNIPYKGMGQAYQNLLSGEISFMFAELLTVLPHIRVGKVIPLAISQRAPHLPDLPTVGEAGFPNSAVHANFMVAVPTGTSVAIINRLNGEINRLMKTPDIAARLDKMALVPQFGSPEEFADRLKSERERWAGIIKRLNLKIDD